MAELTGKAVSELPEATKVNDADLLAISQYGSSKKATKQTLLADVTNPQFTLASDSVSDLFQFVITAVANKDFPWDRATHTYTNTNGSWMLVGYVFNNGKYASFVATSYRGEAVVIRENNESWTCDPITNSWVQVGTMTGGNDATLTNLPINVHEYLIVWRMHTGFAYNSIEVPAGTTTVNDSFWYSANYYESVRFTFSGGSLQVSQSWTTGNYNDTALSKSDVTATIYAR